MSKERMFLARKIILPIILVSIFCTFCNPGLYYEMEMIAEFSPGDNYLSSLSIGYPNPFGPKPTNLVDTHNSRIFKVDNNGRIYYWRFSDNDIIIHDVSAGQFDSLIPAISENESLRGFWLGPRDEVYTIILENHNRNRKLYRYFNVDGDYVLDDDFISPELFDISRTRNISPDGKLFFCEQYINNHGRSSFDVYSPEGNFIKNSFSPCETSDGSEFYLKKSDDSARENRTRIKIEKGNVLVLGTSDILSLKCTLNNLIIIVNRDYKRISLDDEKELVVDKPVIHIIDLKKGHITIDPFYECYNPDYAFHTVSNVECNYKGEIFATVIYFNIPGKIIGDEKIVLYRWRNLNEQSEQDGYQAGA